MTNLVHKNNEETIKYLNNGEIIKHLNLELDTFLGFISKEFQHKISAPMLLHNSDNEITDIFVVCLLKCNATSQEILTFLKLSVAYHPNFNLINFSIAFTSEQALTNKNQAVLNKYLTIFHQLKSNLTNWSPCFDEKHFKVLNNYLEVSPNIMYFTPIHLITFGKNNPNNHHEWDSAVNKIGNFFAY